LARSFHSLAIEWPCKHPTLRLRRIIASPRTGFGQQFTRSLAIGSGEATMTSSSLALAANQRFQEDCLVTYVFKTATFQLTRVGVWLYTVALRRHVLARSASSIILTLHSVLPSFTPREPVTRRLCGDQRAIPTHVDNAFTPFLWGEGLE